MLLRNYDNIMAGKRLPDLSFWELTTGSTYGDGFINIKSFDSGSMESVLRNCADPLQYFGGDNTANAKGGSAGTSLLVCGTDDTDVTYDTTNITLATNCSYINHSISDLVYDSETKTYSRTYKKRLFANANITIKNIGVLYSYKYNYTGFCCLVYKQKLDTPIEVPANTAFELSITVTQSANPNEPVQVSTNIE